MIELVASGEKLSEYVVKTCFNLNCKNQEYQIVRQGQATRSPAVHVDCWVELDGRMKTGERQTFCSVRCLYEYMKWPWKEVEDGKRSS